MRKRTSVSFAVAVPVLSLSLLVSGCTFDRSDAFYTSGTGPTSRCGLHAIPRYDRISGMAIPACSVPDDDAIASLCSVHDGEALGGDPLESEVEYFFPEYEVRNARCQFVDDKNTQANCRFDVRDQERSLQWVSQERVFDHVFRDLSDDIAHDFFMTTWATETSCLPK